MEVVKYIVLAIYAIVCIGLIILTTIQTSDDKGVSGTITGSSTNNFFDQNKGRTKEGKLKKWTIILGILFGVLSIEPDDFQSIIIHLPVRLFLNKASNLPLI